MSIVSPANILGRLATQQYAEKTVAQPERYVLEAVYYELLEAAKRSVTQRCTALNAAPTAAPAQRRGSQFS